MTRFIGGVIGGMLMSVGLALVDPHSLYQYAGIVCSVVAGAAFVLFDRVGGR